MKDDKRNKIQTVMPVLDDLHSFPVVLVWRLFVDFPFFLGISNEEKDGKGKIKPKSGCSKF
jgi:hypothetical protein